MSDFIKVFIYDMTHCLEVFPLWIEECGLCIFKTAVSVSARASLMMLREGSQLYSHKLITGLKALVQIMDEKINIL